LTGKNVSILMPPPFSTRHNTFLRNYVTTSKAKILDSVREVGDSAWGPACQPPCAAHAAALFWSLTSAHRQ
jgi:hypothetical protein